MNGDDAMTEVTKRGRGVDPSVLIVLSSYNGAKYLAQQIESIQEQTFVDWTLLVRDDGSSDGTVRLTETLAARDPRIVMLQDQRGNLGPVTSFGVLLSHALDARARYVALADQDDVWHPNKLAGELAALRSREAERGAGVPLLVHSDLVVAAEDLATIHPSFMARQGLDHLDDEPLRRLLLQNFVTGCTVLLNQALLRAALPLPEQAVMHDWWLALCAAALGEVVYFPEPTLRYRQHGTNVTGSRGLPAAVIASLRRPLAWWRRSEALFAAALGQAGALVQRIDALEPSFQAPAATMVREYHDTLTGRRSPLQRLRTVRRYRIAPRSAAPLPLSYYTRVLLGPGRREPGRGRAGSQPS